MGKRTELNGTTFDGHWIMGKMKGHGIKILPNGTIFEGEWDGSHFLKGKCQFPDGQIYDGEWTEGKPEGFGVKVWTDGRRYEG